MGKKSALIGNASYRDLATMKTELQTDDIIGTLKIIGYTKELSKVIYAIPLLKFFNPYYILKIITLQLNFVIK